jgi:hypothetical protein
MFPRRRANSIAPTVLTEKTEGKKSRDTVPLMAYFFQLLIYIIVLGSLAAYSLSTHFNSSLLTF